MKKPIGEAKVSDIFVRRTPLERCLSLIYGSALFLKLKANSLLKHPAFFIPKHDNLY